ncbi:hypothetical protein SKAU_G00360320 [Synaphobranchus kaupii]|uniref:Putative nuclease HARBI1 n=1 Tax=Synaphobranchus kaupii TaxID=118154 RepID=A0A9Q1EI40_SYNKA|nr:hypothetical protein SKAU_G00360320 [Synaphobranchus kaupii]
MERQNQTFSDHSQWPTLPLKRKNNASGQSTPENDDGKRVRMRYSKEEEEKLIKEVIKRWDQLYGTKSRFLPWGRKTSTWSEIAAQLGETSKGARAGEDVRKKWLYMKRVFLEKVEAQRSSRAETGPQLTPLEHKLLSLLRQPPAQPCNVPDIGAPRMDMSRAETDVLSSAGRHSMGFFSGYPGDADISSSRSTARSYSGFPLATDEVSCAAMLENQVGDTDVSAGDRREDDPDDERPGRAATPTSRNPGRQHADDGAPAMAAIVNRQRLSVSVQMEAVKVLRRLVGDVHRYIERITATGADLNESDVPSRLPGARAPAPSAAASVPIQLALLHDDVLLERFRFDRGTVAYLCAVLRPHIANSWMQAEGTVCTALAFYATGAFQSPMGDSFDVDQTAVRSIVELVSDALVTVSDQFIKFPTSATQKQVQQDFLSVAGFPGVVGALGCTHVAIRRPDVSPNLYVNRKHFYSMNLQITTTADCRISSAVARFPGSFSCSHVLQHSPLEAFCSKGNLGTGHLIAHSGYPLNQWLLPPLPNAHTKADVHYNEALRQTHAVVGKTVRLLKARFPCLDRSVLPLQCPPKSSARIILACCVLHNVAVSRDVKFPGRSAGVPAELPAAQEDYNCESDEETLSDSEEIVQLRVTAGQEKQAVTIQQFFT